MLVQALVAKPPVEALGETVLHRLPRLDVVPLDSVLLLPLEHSVRGQFGAVVADHQSGIAPPLGDPVQFTGNTDAG